MRMTFDYQENERKMANWMADRCDEIAKAMGAKTTQVNRLNVPWSVVPYQTTHNTGGAVMGERSQDQCAQSLSAILGRARMCS